LIHFVYEAYEAVLKLRQPLFLNKKQHKKASYDNGSSDDESTSL